MSFFLALNIFLRIQLINIFGPLNNLGTGVHCYNMAKALEILGEEVCVIPPFGSFSIDDNNIRAWSANRKKFSLSDPSLMIFDMPFLLQFSGSPRIGFCLFETDSISENSLIGAQSCDLLLTPSEWGRRVLALHDLKAHVVPEGYDPEVFKASFDVEEPEKTFSFFSVGKYELRKGTLQLISCFAREFSAGEDVSLFLKCDNPFVSDYREIGALIAQMGFSETANINQYRRGGNSISFIPGDISTAKMASLYRSADCCVFPTKGEGWGLSILEAIVSGTPTIVGRWTGQADYLSDNYPKELLLSVAGTTLAYDGIFFNGKQGFWNLVSDEDLTARMRWAYVNARNLRIGADWKLSVLFSRNFTWVNAAQKFLEVISEVRR